MPIVTKRRCVGTTAKLTICVGMNTPLQKLPSASSLPRMRPSGRTSYGGG